MNKRIRIILMSIFATIALSGMATACTNEESSSSVNPPNSDIVMPAEEVNIEMKTSESVEEFETVTLTAQVKGSKEAIVWKSSDTSIATVDTNGVVSALKAGAVTITATVEDVTAECALTVQNTTTAHLLAFDVETAKMYNGMTKEVNASVSHKGEVVDNTKYALQYTWTLMDGFATDVVSIVTENGGATAKFTALKAGEVAYDVSTIARGYEVHNTIVVKVLENIVNVGFENEQIVESETDFSTNITLGGTTNGRLSVGKVYPVLNGVPFKSSDLTVSWVSNDEDVVEVDNGTIVGKKAGTTVLVGTGTYQGTAFSFNLTVKVVKNQVVLTDVMTVETVSSTFVLPSTMDIANLEKVTFNSSNVVFDAKNSKGTVDGRTVTVDLQGMPANRAELGLGKTMTVETATTVYTLTANIYTMIINDKAELDNWQAVAVDNSVRAGLCVEEQKLAVLSGYFVLGNDIEYNGVWYPIIPYAYATPSINDLLNSTNLLATLVAKYGAEAVIKEDWTLGVRAGFQGVFDGQGYSIAGLKVTGDYNAFVVTNGSQGIIRNLSFIDVSVGAGASVVCAMGQGTVENIYIDVNTIEETTSKTYIVRGQTSTEQAIIQNVLVDVGDCNNIQSLQNTELVYNDQYIVVKGVFVVGVTQDINASFITDGDVDLLKGFMTASEMLSDETYGDRIKAWDSAMWNITDSLVLPVKLVEKYAGDIHFENKTSDINKNSSLTLKTDKDAKFIVYTLQDATTGVSINGNVLTVGQGATVGEYITVIATSLIDGKTAQFTLEIVGELVSETVQTRFYVEQFNGNKALLTHTDFVVGQVWTNPLSGESSTVEKTGELLVNLGSVVLSTKDAVSIYSVSVKNGTKLLQFTNVMAVTAVIRTAEDLKGFGAQGKYVDKDDSTIKGYYIVGNDIDCNGAGKFTGLYNQEFMVGVFDGNGKTISNISVGSHGIFGSMSGATVKNVNFTNVRYEKDEYTTLFAGYVNSTTTFSNITVQVNSANFSNTHEALLVVVCGASLVLENVEIDASGIDLDMVFGYLPETYQIIATNVVIKAKSFAVIGYKAWGPEEESKITELPEGITFTQSV